MGTAFTTRAAHLADQRSYDDESNVETLWAHRGFGGIHTNAAQSAQSIANGATSIQITGFTADTIKDGSGVVVPDYAANEVGVTVPGDYKVTYYGKLTLVNGIAYTFNIFSEGAAVTPNFVVSGLTAVPDKDVCIQAYVTVAAAGDIDVRVKHDNGSAQNITVLHQSLTVERME